MLLRNTEPPAQNTRLYFLRRNRKASRASLCHMMGSRGLAFQPSLPQEVAPLPVETTVFPRALVRGWRAKHKNYCVSQRRVRGKYEAQRVMCGSE